jgi:hypothetical protein
LGYGVIGNTEVSGTFVLGSSPGTPALKTLPSGGVFALTGLLETHTLVPLTLRSGCVEILDFGRFADLQPLILAAILLGNRLNSTII